MLASTDAVANVAVRNLEAARKFYEGTLGLKPVHEEGKGVAFEHDEIPDTRLEGDVHVSGDMRVAWFRDPDGNILNLFGRRSSG